MPDLYILTAADVALVRRRYVTTGWVERLCDSHEALAKEVDRLYRQLGLPPLNPAEPVRTVPSANGQVAAGPDHLNPTAVSLTAATG